MTADWHVEYADGRVEPIAPRYVDSLCGEPTCYHGGVIINGRDYRCAECVRLGYVDAATGQVLLMEGERP